MVIIGLAIVFVGTVAWAVTRHGSNVIPVPAPAPKQTSVQLSRPALVRAQDASAQATLRNALVAAKTDHADSRSYLHATPQQLATIEPSLSYVDAGTASTGPTEVSVAAISRSTWAAAALSESGACFFIKNVNERVTYGTGGNGCTGSEANSGATDRSFPPLPE